MAKVEEIKHAIEKLTEEELIQIRNWFLEKDWIKWDKAIERDSAEGKLDFLIKGAKKAKKEGQLRPL